MVCILGLYGIASGVAWRRRSTRADYGIEEAANVRDIQFGGLTILAVIAMVGFIVLAFAKTWGISARATAPLVAGSWLLAWLCVTYFAIKRILQ